MSSQDPATTPPTPSRWVRSSALPISVLVLGSVLIALIGFGVGYLTGDHGGGHRHRDTDFAPDGRVPRGTIAGVHGPFMGSGSGAAPIPPFGQVIAGAVTGVDGNSFAIRTLRGETISVHTSDATIVRLASAGAVSGLKPGEIVFISGSRASDGSILASRVLGGFAQPSAGGSG